MIELWGLGKGKTNKTAKQAIALARAELKAD